MPFPIRAVRVVSAIVFALTMLPPAHALLAQAPPHPSASRASEAPGFALDDLLASIQANPELAAAHRRIVAASQRPERGESLPDPTIGLLYRNVGFPELTLGDEMMSVLGFRVSQALPAGGKRPGRRAVAERQVDLATANAESLRHQLIREVATTFHELVFVHDTIDVVTETRDLLLELERTAEARYAVGDGIQQDVLKAQVEISVLLNRLVHLGQQRASLEARLNNLIGRPASTPMGRPIPAPVSLEQLPAEMLGTEARQASATLRAREARIDEQTAAVELVRANRKPDWLLSAAYMNRGGLTGIWELNVGVTIPIRKSNRQDLEIEENLQELGARRAEHLDAIRDVDFVVHDSLLRADRAVRLTRLYEDAIVPQATLSLESAMAGYGVGRVDFLTVLDNVVTLLTYRVEIYRERADYATALVRIEEHLGRSLGATPRGTWRNPQTSNPEERQ